MAQPIAGHLCSCLVAQHYYLFSNLAAGNVLELKKLLILSMVCYLLQLFNYKPCGQLDQSTNQVYLHNTFQQHGSSKFIITSNIIKKQKNTKL